MIHPLKAATSFECDGCGHHASFHKMDNAIDEETVRRWKNMETLRDQGHETMVGLIDVVGGAKQIALPKRRRIENLSASERVDEDVTEILEPKTKAKNRKRVNGG